ncbi:hypothetical protein [Actinomadura macra]|uniref:hypothetical protein n=1 Tax=Actinomadura macra TaxID=46164 RepID=UPI0008357AB1|nr:hypothetical protein [Actinomadura macra]
MPDRSQAPAAGEKRTPSAEGPDVHLDVPLLKVDEISLEVADLEAHVSLVAQVLDLLRLNVGADVFLGRVKLDIRGVEAQALLDVRLNNVAEIVDRVLTTLDRNPEILQHVGRGVEAAARGIGTGAGEAVREVGRGTGGAVQEVGRGAGGAVQDVGRGAGGAVQDVGRGAGGAVEGVGRGAGGAVQEVGKGTGHAVEGVGEGAGGAVGDAGAAVEGVGTGTGQAVGGAAEGAGKATQGEGEGAGGTAGGADGDSGDSETSGGGGTDEADPDDVGAVRSALRETEESVRGLGRALFQKVTK